ncbi:MAG: ABC transporter ATP-binding protein [Bryobacteraceae bacterium]
MVAIEFNNVSKSFLRGSSRMLLRSFLGRRMNGSGPDRFYALKGVSFSIDHGDRCAVVGHNGAGKSTLLGLVAGLAYPDRGSVSVNGRMAALLELGSGFHPDLTGAENLRLNAALLGLSRARTDALYEKIVEFSGLDEFIREPLRTYSSGMVLRLAFSVAVNVDPDILIIDEVLAVGDENFQAKCAAKIQDMKDAGKTLLCVSHVLPAVEALCNRALWLDHGKVLAWGEIGEVLEQYRKSQES